VISDEDLARWKALVGEAGPPPLDGNFCEGYTELIQQALPALIAEVERLRAQVSASHPEETDAGRIVYLPSRPLGMLHPVDTPSGTVTFKVSTRDAFCGPPEAPHTFRVRWFAWEQQFL
jgi:hypothetical protein